MQKAIRSFSVGAALEQGKFIAFLLKIRFEDRTELLTAWVKEKVALLLRMLLEYQQYLSERNIEFNSDSIESIIRNEAPVLSTFEIENLPVSSIVDTAAGNVRKDNMFVLSIKRVHSAEADVIAIAPNQCEWLAGFTANTLNEFEESGAVIMPSGQSN